MTDIAGLSTPELDRLWLLDRLWEHRVPVSIFVSPSMGDVLNAHPPPSGRQAVPSVIAAAWRDGLVELHDVHPVALLGTRDLYRRLTQVPKRRRGERWPGPRLGLTPAGGALWEHAFEVRWASFVQTFEPASGWSGVGLERSAVERELARVRHQVGAVDVRWDTVAPFRPAYWRSPFPRGHRASVASCPRVHLLEVEPLPWRGNRYVGVDDLAPVDLTSAGWTKEARVPTERLCRVPVLDARSGDGVYQLRLERVDGQQGVLDLRPRTPRILGGGEPWEVEGCSVLRVRLRPGAVEVQLGWGDPARLDSYTMLWLREYDATWWRPPGAVEGREDGTLETGTRE